MARTKFQEGPITIRLEPMEMIQLKNICAILKAPSIEGLCLGFIRDGILQETQGILAHFAKVALEDQETDPSPIGRARDACGPVCDPDWTSTTAPTQAAFRLKRNPKLPYQGEPFPDELDPPDLDKKGLRGGEADEESLQKAQGTERANMHGTRNADLDPTHPQGTLGASGS